MQVLRLLQKAKRMPADVPGTRGSARAQPFLQEAPQCGPGSSLRNVDHWTLTRRAKRKARTVVLSNELLEELTRKRVLCEARVVRAEASRSALCLHSQRFEAHAARCLQRTCKTAQQPRRPPATSVAPGSSQRRSECRTSQCVCRPHRARWRAGSLYGTHRTDGARRVRHRRA